MGYKVAKIGIEVKNLEESLVFYQDVLGMAVMERFPRDDGGENVFLDAGGVILELMSSEKPVFGNLHHIAIGTECTEKEAEDFRQKGVRLTMEPVIVEENIHLADMQDPDGIRIRMFHRDKEKKEGERYERK